ncbi:glucosylglycerol hydrolase, partial [Arthrospira platensis SPKY2]
MVECERSIPPAQIRLTLFLPPPGFDPTLPAQTAPFERVRLPVIQAGEYVWCVAQGVPAGRRDQVGAFYWLTYQDRSGRWQRIVDP